MKGTTAAVVGGLIALVGAISLVLSGDKSVNVVANTNGLVSVITFGGALPKPPNADIVCVQGRADCTPRCMAFIKQDAGAGLGAEDIIVRSCGREWDGGSPIPDLAEQIDDHLIFDKSTLREVAYDGGPAVVFFRGSARDAEHLCACAPPGGTSCERMNTAGAWVATTNWDNIIESGKWRGAGCLKMACDRMFGRASNKPAGCQ